MSMAGALDRVAYALEQTARVAFYGAHYAGGRALGGRIGREGEAPFTPQARMPDRATLLRAIRALFDRDWANIAAGLYLPPEGPSPRALAAGSARYFGDVRKVAARRRAHGHSEVKEAAPDPARYPRYYLQNFHYQTGGWLSDESAKLYDFQVETLFAGTADAMRRQALPHIRAALAGKDQRRCALLDVACGTGRFLRQVKQNFPRLPVTALDLSQNYLGEARRTLRPWRDVSFVEGAAEKMPLPDAAFDVVTCVYLFHELPPKVRSAAAREIARVLKPGGAFVFVDSLQTGDTPALDALLELFPVGFHEPYYAGYTKLDLAGLFAPAGLTLDRAEPAFLSKVAVFRKD